MNKLMPVDIDRWYGCYYIESNELCKVVRATIDVQETGTKVFAYKVVCYYTGKDVYIGSLADCKQWIREHVVGGKYYYGD